MDPLLDLDHDPHGDAETAIDRACARLGRPRAWIADDGYEHEIVAGAVDDARVAWVERRALERPGQYVDVDYYLRVRAGDALLREWTVDTYNPYFGCDVGALKLLGDDVVMIYREKHATIAAALGPAGAPRMRRLSDHWRLLGDVVLHASEARGLVERFTLPTLAPLAPLPAAVAADHLSHGTSPRVPPAGVDAAALQRRILARLPRATAPIAEMLVGALAYRFWDDPPPLAARYDDLERVRWNPPCWLPFYAHHAAGPTARRAILEALDAAATRPPAGDPADVAELACRHIADRARELAAACRVGHLPEETSCYFWADWSRAAFGRARDLFPAGLWATWTALEPRARDLLALGSER